VDLFDSGNLYDLSDVEDEEEDDEEEEEDDLENPILCENIEGETCERSFFILCSLLGGLSLLCINGIGMVSVLLFHK